MRYELHNNIYGNAPVKHTALNGQKREILKIVF